MRGCSAAGCPAPAGYGVLPADAAVFRGSTSAWWKQDHSCLPGAYEDVENDWIRTVADTLATEMNGATQDAGSWAVFSDPRDEFDGKGVSGNPENIHGIVETGREHADKDAPNPSMQSFHPNPAGARLYADALEHTLQRK